MTLYLISLPPAFAKQQRGEETFFQTLLLTSPFCNTLLRHEFLPPGVFRRQIIYPYPQVMINWPAGCPAAGPSLDRIRAQDPKVPDLETRKNPKSLFINSS